MRRSRAARCVTSVLLVALLVGSAPGAIGAPRGTTAAEAGAPNEALKDAVVAWSSHAPSPRLDGDASWFNATFDSSETPAFGVLRVRDATTDTILGSVDVTSTHAFIDTGLVVLALGSHDIRAEFVGDPAFVQASDQVTIEVLPDTVVEATVFELNLTTFYPRAEAIGTGSGSGANARSGPAVRPRSRSSPSRARSSGAGSSGRSPRTSTRCCGTVARRAGRC